MLGEFEELPFRDRVFDAVVSVAGLAHGKDSLRCGDGTGAQAQ
jgi:ubiquinone/menaquinone biosynthesis C-methylase UbiE